MLDRQDVLRHVMRKRHLAPASAATRVADVVDDLVGLHATSATTPYVSLHARMPAFTRADLDRELYERRRYLRLGPAAYDAVAPMVLSAAAGHSLTVAEIRAALGTELDVASVVTLLCDEGRLVRDRPTGSWRSAFWFDGPVPVAECKDMVPLAKRSGWLRTPLDGATVI